MKTRLQIGGKYAQLGIGGTASVIAKEEGIISFWKGIGPAWLREASYTSLRLGLYSPIKVGAHFARVLPLSTLLLSAQHHRNVAIAIATNATNINATTTAIATATFSRRWAPTSRTRGLS